MYFNFLAHGQTSNEFRSGSMDGRLAILCLFEQYFVISERWVGDNKRLYAMVPRLQLKGSSPQAGLEPGTARSAAFNPLSYPLRKCTER